MSKKIFKRLAPDPGKVKVHRSLAFLVGPLHDSNLFHLNRDSVSLAFLVGVFCAFLPLPGQMPIATVIALIVRCNLPIAVGLVFLTNPITTPPILFASYELGTWLLQIPQQDFTIELDWHWLTNVFVKIWKPLMVGSLACGIFFSVTAYVSVRLFWRYHVGVRWRKRQKREREKACNHL
jgi:uncharacterized protein